jgi:hypothetical protein
VLAVACVLLGLFPTASVRAPLARRTDPALIPTFELRPPPRGPPA